MILYRCCLITALFFTLSSCSQKLFKAAVIKKNNVQGTYTLPAIQTTGKDVQEDCVEVFVIFPNKMSWNKETLYEKICPNSEYLQNVELIRKFFLIPLIYSRDCLELKAECGNG